MAENLAFDLPAQTCEMRRDTYNATGGYWFMRCSYCNQQTNEHLVMLPHWLYCQTCGARIVAKEGEEEWMARKERGEV